MSEQAVRTLTVTVSDEALSNALFQVKRTNDNGAAWFGQPAWATTQESVGDGWTVTLTAPVPVVNGLTVLGVLVRGDYQALAGTDSLQPDNVAITANNIPCLFCGTRRERTRYLLRTQTGNLVTAGVTCGENRTVEVNGSEHPGQGRSLTSALAFVAHDPRIDMLSVNTRVQNSSKYDTMHLLASARRHYQAYSDGPQSPATLARLIALDAEYSDDAGWLPEIEDRLLEAAVVRAEFLERPVVTDFDDAVRRALLRSENSVTSFRLIASVPALHSKMARVQRAIEAGDPIPGEGYLNAHFGQVGQRYTVSDVIVERTKRLESGSVLVSMRSPEGHRLTWFCTNGLFPEDGQHVTLTGTVKAHNIYREVRDTVVNRCKFQ